MTSTLTGQLILGTDKRNPLFTVYVEEEEQDDQERLHVYYGLELLEVCPRTATNQFQNAGGPAAQRRVSLRVLQQTFESDAKTIQRWGRALRSRMRGAHQGAGRPTRQSQAQPEIKAYVRVRWSDMVREGSYGIGKRLRQEIRRILGVKLLRRRSVLCWGVKAGAVLLGNSEGELRSNNRRGSPTVGSKCF